MPGFHRKVTETWVTSDGREFPSREEAQTAERTLVLLKTLAGEPGKPVKDAKRAGGVMEVEEAIKRLLANPDILVNYKIEEPKS